MKKGYKFPKCADCGKSIHKGKYGWFIWKCNYYHRVTCEPKGCAKGFLR
jgi:hypothetical protein